VSNIGTLMQSVGSAWVMGDLGASPTLVASVQTASFLPLFLLGIPSGALADIVDRRRLLIATQVLMIAAAGALAALAFADQITPLSLLALTFSLGVGGALAMPAWQAVQPDLVPRHEFPQAIALGSLAFNLGRAIGPALGGLVLAAAGAQWVFAINAVSFAGTLVALLRWRQVRVETRLPAETLAGATRAALRYGMNAPILRTVLLRLAALLMPAAALQALLPIVVRGPLDLGSGAYGALLACFGIGAAGGAVVRPRLEERLSYDAMVVWSSVILAAALVVQGYADLAPAVGVALFVAGLAWTTALTTLNVAAQATLAPWVRARGMGLFMLVLTGSMAAGSVLWGALADWSVAGAHAAAAAALVALTILVRHRRLAVTARLDVTPVPGVDPMVTLTPAPDDGPVLVTLAYRVRASDMAEFVAAMRRTEGHRRRTGAYRWGLFRDLADPERILETFVVDSWAEHLRQHHRATASVDAHLQAVYAHLDGTVAVGHYLSAYSPSALELSAQRPAASALGEEPGSA
jgi:MFS family permease